MTNAQASLTLKGKPITIRKGYGFKCGMYLQDFHRSDGSTNGTVVKIISYYKCGSIHELSVKLSEKLIHSTNAIVDFDGIIIN